MRHYSLSMGIIGKRVIAATLCVWAVALGCASDSGVDDTLPDYLWYRAQSAQAVEAQGLPPVVVQGTRVDGSELLADIIARPESDEKNAALNFVLTVPAGEITSASLTVQSIKDDEGTSLAETKNQREQSVSVKDLGFVRGNRIVRVQLPSVIPGTAGARLESGVLRINYGGIPVIHTDDKISGTPLDSPIENILNKLVANPADIARFAMPLNDVPEPANTISGPPVGGYPDAVARFRLTEPGLVKFRGADLAACGVKLDDI